MFVGFIIWIITFIFSIAIVGDINPEMGERGALFVGAVIATVVAGLYVYITSGDNKRQ